MTELAQTPALSVGVGEAGWQGLLDTLSDAVVIYNAEGVVLACNEASKEVLGFDPVTTRDPSVVPCTYGADGREIPDGEQPARLVVETGEPQARLVGLDHRGADGTNQTRCWFWAEATPLPHPRDQARTFALRLRDLTEQVHTMTSLEQRDADFRMLAEHTNDLITHHTIDGDFLWVSPSSVRTIGWTPEELKALDSPWSLLHPDDSTGMLADNTRIRAGEQGVISLVRIRHKDGHWVWMESASKASTGEDGTIAFITCSWRDVSERVEAESIWRQAIHNSSIGGALITPDLICTEANDALCQLLGLSREELVGASISSLTSVEQRGAADTGWDRLVTGELTTLTATRTVTRPDATVAHLEIHLSPIRRHDGELRVVFAQVVDVTEQEQSLERLRDDAETWRIAIDSTAVGAVLMTPEGLPVHLNEALRTMIGVQDSDVPQESLFLAVHPEDQPAQARLISRLRSPGQGPYTSEFRLLRPDGRAVLVEGHMAPIRNKAGDLTMLACQIIDISEQRTAAARLAWAATHDRLTGLANREEFTLQVRSAIDRLGPMQVAVLVLDLDRFTLVNDSLGHEEGDLLLKEVAAALAEETQACVQRTGIDAAVVARLGGDEFAVLLEGVPSPRVAQVIADLLTARVTRPLQVSAGVDIRLSASTGVAVGRVDSSAGDLLQDSAAARFRAKQRGRDRVATYDSALRAEAVKALRIRTRLAAALDAGNDGGLTLAFQPVVDCATGELISAEALSRWHDAELGFVAPNEFIPVAEETGLIRRLGRRVLGTACSELARWRRDFPDKAPRSVAVNLSPVQFADADLGEHIMGALSTYSLPPDCLTIEITESVLLGDAEAPVAMIDRLTRLGVQVALDDFGTGYSSLTYLRRLPVDVVKIDKSFVDGLGVSAADESIVKAITMLCHDLGKRVVAEGVETPEQLAAMNRMGIDLAQGYLLGRPVSGTDFSSTWLAD